MSDNFTSTFNSISGPASPENNKNIYLTATKKVIEEQEHTLFPKDRVEISRETLEPQPEAPYKLSHNPDVNLYIETINEAVKLQKNNPENSIIDKGNQQPS